MPNLSELAQSGVEHAKRYITGRCQDGTYKVPYETYSECFGSKTAFSDEEVKALDEACKVLRTFDYLFDLPSDGEIEDPGDFDKLAEAAIKGLVPPQEALLRLNRAFEISGEYKYYTLADFSDGSPNAPSDYGSSPYRHYLNYDDSPKRITKVFERIVNATGIDLQGLIRKHLDELSQRRKNRELISLLAELVD